MQRAKQIWVDADACPNAIKDILYRAAQRTGIKLVLVANTPLKIPPNQWVEQVTVEKGFDVADSFIAQRVCAGDIVITADIPLAADLVEKDCVVINARGERYTRDNVRQRLQMRNAMEELRSSGIHTGGPPPLTQRDKQLFANQLDSLLLKIARSDR